MKPKMRNPITSWKQFQPEQMKIFGEMFKRVNADIKSFDFSPDNWYEAYCWTEEEEADFKNWLEDQIKKIWGLSDKATSSEAAFFLLGWGWTCSQERCDQFRKANDFVPVPYKKWYTPIVDFFNSLM